MTAILGWAQLLLRMDNPDVPKVQRGLKVIERNSMAELRLVETLLDVSSIIRGKMDLKPQSVSMAGHSGGPRICNSSCGSEARLYLAIARRGDQQGLGRSRPPRADRGISCSNAIKFTPPGGRVAVSLEEVGAMSQLRISDTGEGISADFLPHVFDQFRQANSSTTRRHGGLGLGLAIVRDLVRMHGGTVRAESGGEGQGAVFTVDLPLMPVVEETATPPLAGAGEGGVGLLPSMLTGLRVLVVDDDSDVRELLTCILGEAGAEVRVAAAAREGLELLQEWRPDVLVSDIGLPDESGYALIRAVRALPVNQGGQTPAIALTAYADQRARKQALSAGYEMHIPKPVERTTLMNVVARLGTRTGARWPGRQVDWRPCLGRPADAFDPSKASGGSEWAPSSCHDGDPPPSGAASGYGESLAPAIEVSGAWSSSNRQPSPTWSCVSLPSSSMKSSASESSAMRSPSPWPSTTTSTTARTVAGSESFRLDPVAHLHHAAAADHEARGAGEEMAPELLAQHVHRDAVRGCIRRTRPRCASRGRPRKF